MCIPVAMPSNNANTLIGFLSSAGIGDINSGGSYQTYVTMPKLSLHNKGTAKTPEEVCARVRVKK